MHNSGCSFLFLIFFNHHQVVDILFCQMAFDVKDMRMLKKRYQTPFIYDAISHLVVYI
jgi:hypothetical protein